MQLNLLRLNLDLRIKFKLYPEKRKLMFIKKSWDTTRILLSNSFEIHFSNAAFFAPPPQTYSSSILKGFKD